MLMACQVCYTILLSLVPLLYNSPSPVPISKQFLQDPNTWTHGMLDRLAL
jgi:uncharacterized BrkB/YihY/UPF0761 family membrane protein